MNIFLVNWDYNYKYALATAKRLESHGCKIAYWVGANNKDVLEQNRQDFSRTIFHNRQEAALGKPSEEFTDVQFAPPGEEIIKNFYETESILSTIKQFEKLDKSGFEKKNLYHCYLQYWLGVIDKLKPDAIVFTVCPHTGFDFIIYSIAKFLKVKTIYFHFTVINDRHVLVNDFTVGSLPLKKEIEIDKNKKYKIDDLEPDIRDHYLEQINKANDPALPKLKNIKKEYAGFSLLLIKLKMIALSILDLSIFKKLFLFYKKKTGHNFRKEYFGLQGRADFNKKFIYVPLHFQPECATAPLGGVFVDQTLMIKILSAAAPDDWLIYVKEHPYQWLLQGINYTHARYQGFFEAIAKIKKIKIIPVDTATTELIEKSQAIATVTGTVGWEAVLRQRPALIFGNPPFRFAPGIFKVNDVKSCQAVLTKIKSGYTINRQDIINYLFSFGKISIHTSFEKTADIISLTMPPEEYANILAEAIIKDIENNK